MRKLSILLLTIAFLLVLTACGAKTGTTDTSADTTEGKYQVTTFQPDQMVEVGDIKIKYYIMSENGDEGGAPMLEVYYEGDDIVYNEIALDNYAEYAKESYILDDGTNQYAFIQMGYSNDWTESVLVKLDGETSHITDGPMSYSMESYQEGGNAFILSTKVDVFGSYGGLKTFALIDDKMVTEDEEFTFAIIDDYNTELTVKKDFMAYKEDGSQLELKAGDVICPTGTDQKGTFRFTYDKGKAGYFKYDVPEDNSVEYSVDGVDQYELFDFLPYAG